MGACGGSSAGWVLLAAVLGLLAISGDSLWIDEAHCAVAAREPGVSGWLRRLVEVPSDVQLSGYFFQLWLWEKLAGSGEWALRLNNYPWFLGALLAWVAAVPRRLRGAMALSVGLSPFLVYYVGELRPYTMVFCGASLMAAALVRGVRAGFSRRWYWCFGLGAIVALAASSSTIPWVGVSGVALGVLALRQRPRTAFPWDVVGGLALPGVAVLCLSVGSFLHGARAASPEPGSLASLLFAPYELLGFMGMGPGRAQLRAGGVAGLKPFLPAIGIMAGALAAVAVAGVRALGARVGWRGVCGWGALYALPLVAVAGVGFYSGLRTTGRHFTPALAFILPVLALGLQRAWHSRGRGVLRAAAVAVLIGWAASGAMIRTAERHKREDYREAARIAREAAEGGQEVWWLADTAGAEYYHLSLRKEAFAGQAVRGRGSARWIANAEAVPTPEPDLVLYSRADVYDNRGVVAEWMAASGYRVTRQLHGFAVWERVENN